MSTKEIEVLKNDGASCELKVTLGQDEIQNALTEELKEIQQKVTLKGFRKGKAPLESVRAMYGEEVSQKAMEKVVSKSYAEAVHEKGLHPIAPPEIDIAPDSDGGEGSFSYIARFEMKPEFEINDLSQLKVTEESTEVSEEDLENVYKSIQDRHAEHVLVFEDRPAKDKDWVKVDFDGFLDNNTPLENGSSKDFLICIGENMMIPGFEEGIIGMKVDEERVLDLSFPEDYHQPTVAGKPVRFNLKLKSINKKKLPELNDELAKKEGQFESLADLQEKVKEQVTNSKQQQAEENLKTQILDSVLEIHDFPLPPSIVAQEVHKLQEMTSQRLISQGFDPQKLTEYHAKWLDDYKKNAEKSVKLFFLVDAIATKQELYPTENDIDEYFAELSGKTGIDVEKIRSYYAPQEKQRELEFKIMEENVLKYLKSQIQVTAAT